MSKLKRFLLLFVFISSGVFAQTSESEKLILFFEEGKSSISKSERDKLDAIKGLGDEKFQMEGIQITGYSDSKGNSDLNLSLSMDRAKAVKLYLSKKGIKPEAFEWCEGRGELMSRTSGKSKGVNKQRRVELVYRLAFNSSVREITAPVVEDVVIIKEVFEMDKIEEELISVQKKILNMKVGDKLVIENLIFLPGRHVLREESKAQVQILLKVMMDNPAVKIEIQGHVCCETIRKDGYDMDTREFKLSTNRAKYVYDYLVTRGIDKNRLKFKGFGRSRPIVAHELTPEDKSTNRRVEIEIIK